MAADEKQISSEQDVLSLVRNFADSWEQSLKDLPADTRSVLTGVTDHDSCALREALVKIDQEIRKQHANISGATVVSVSPVESKPQSSSNDDRTEQVTGSVSEANSTDNTEQWVDAPTFVGKAENEEGLSDTAFDATFVGQVPSGSDSAVRPTMPTMKTVDGTEIPAVIGGYDIEGVLGRGGMGIVYKARQRGLKRDVALKMILAGPHAMEEHLSRFRAEAEAVAQLQHPNIVQIYDIGEHDGLPYFSLEFIEGKTLDEYRHGDPIDAKNAATFVRKIARAMQFAHSAGIIHRDLKPANILLTNAGEPKVTDFGLVKRLEGEEVDGQTQTGTIMGTPHYMAPEQAAGLPTINHSADIWAMGAILYALFTGRPAFVGATTMDTLVQLQSKEPVPPTQLIPNLPKDLETICLKCLHKDPNGRYESADALADDLTRYLNGEPILARPVGRVERTWRWCRRNPVIAGLTTAVVVAMVAGTLVSTIFGIRASQAAVAESAARKDAEEKQELATNNAILAEENEVRAIRQRTVALAAFNTAVEWAGTDLRNVPGTEHFKKRLFSAAVQGLNQLSEITGEDRRDLAIARGYAKAGEGFMEVGQPREAREQFDASHSILERLAETEKDTDPAIHFLRLGRSFRNIGRAVMALEGPEAARSWHEKALAQKQAALPIFADSLMVKNELAETYEDLGRTALELGHPSEAADFLEKAAAYVDEALLANPEDTSALRNQAGARRRIAIIQRDSGMLKNAAANLRTAAETLQHFADQESASSVDRLNAGLFRSDLGDVLLFSGRNEEAAAEYSAAITLISGVREKNPNHVPAKKFHAGALYGLSIAESRMELESADEHLADCVSLRRELTLQGDSNQEFMRSLMFALARSGETDEAIAIAEDQQKTFPEDSSVLYQVASTYALCSQQSGNAQFAETSIQVLREAFRQGFEGKAILHVDPDLEAIRDREDFQTLANEVIAAEEPTVAAE